MADLIASRELDDLVLVEDLTEEGLARTLATRLKDGKMYTSIGPVLVSCNPYKLLTETRSGRSVQGIGSNGDRDHHCSSATPLTHMDHLYPCRPLYDDSVADSYRGRTRLELPPHAFAVAEAVSSS